MVIGYRKIYLTNTVLNNKKALSTFIIYIIHTFVGMVGKSLTCDFVMLMFPKVADTLPSVCEKAVSVGRQI